MQKLKRMNVMLDPALIATLKQQGLIKPQGLSKLLQALLRRYAYNGAVEAAPGPIAGKCPNCKREQLFTACKIPGRCNVCLYTLKH